MKRPKTVTQETDIINRDHLVHLIGTFQSPYNMLRDRALIAFLYVSGVRISELVRKVHKYQIEFEDLNGVRFMIVNNVECLKRRKNKAQRNIPINTEKEAPFIKYIEEYLNTLGSDNFIFPISRQMAYNVVREFEDKYFPHFFRHLRLTHLSTMYGFNSSQLRQFTGWTNDTPAASYVHLNWKDVAKEMV